MTLPNKEWEDNNDSDGVRPQSVTFQLLGDGEPVTGKTVTLPDNGSWSYTFTGLPRYSDGDGGDEITYTVRETNTPKWYTASFSDDGLTVINTHIRFVSTDLAGQKTLNGRDMKADDFEFKIEAADDATSAAITAEKVVLPSENAKSPASADGTAADITLGSITFRDEGTYKFKVSEVIPSGADTSGDKPVYQGVTYDNSVKEVTVVVAKKENANELEIKSITGGAKADLSFTNTYSAEGSFTPEGTKTLEGQSEVPDAAADDNNGAADPADENNNDAAAGDDETSGGGSDGDSNVQTVPDTEGGQQDGDAAEPGSSSAPEPEFMSSTVRSGDIIELLGAKSDRTSAGKVMLMPTATKGNAVPMALTKGQFKFEVRYVSGTDTETVVARGENEASTTGAADITFDKIDYTTGGLKALLASGAATKDEDGNYHISYIVTEKAPNAAFQHNPESYTFEVVITDDGKGNLTAATAAGSQALAFTNRYVTDVATVPVTGLKVLDPGNGTRTLKAGDFTFTIAATSPSNAPMPETTEVTNAAGGGVDFGSIEFTKEDIGDASEKTFTYTITEKTDSTKPFAYDENLTRTVKIKVIDDGEGHLTATTDPESAPLFTFNNKYVADPVEETITKDITINKVLEGADLTADQFTFKIEPGDDVTRAAVDADPALVVMPSPATASNAADGSVAFGKITYKKTGTYKFIISEVIPDDAVENVKDDILYDTATYTVVVVVGDNENGKLKIESQTLSDESTSATFTNKKLRTDLIIEKKLDDFVDHAGNADAAFVFIITGKDESGAVKYRNSAAIQYSADSPAVQTVTVKNVPLDLTITVEEMDSANYSHVGDKVKTATVQTSGDYKNKYFVQFENKFSNNIDPEGGVVNKYNKTSDGYAHEGQQ